LLCPGKDLRQIQTPKLQSPMPFELTNSGSRHKNYIKISVSKNLSGKNHNLWHFADIT